MLRTTNIESLLKPEQLFRNMFPKQQKSLRFFSIKQNKFTQLIHEEIRQKLQQLEHYKKLQASKLGLMMKLAPFTTTKDVSLQSAQCIAMMKSTLGFDQVDINQVTTMQEAQVAESTTLDAAKGLLDIIQEWDQCQLQIDTIRHANGPPSFITKYWIPGILGCVAGNMAVQLLTARQDDIIAWSKEIGITARDFAVNWIWEPVLQVWDTIRLKDERLSVLGKEGLRSDLDVSKNCPFRSYYMTNSQWSIPVVSRANGSWICSRPLSTARRASRSVDEPSTRGRYVYGSQGIRRGDQAPSKECN